MPSPSWWWRAALIDARQREALARIGCGEAGEGGPFAIFAGTFAEPPRVELAPFVFEHDEWTGRIRLGELAEAEIGPLRSDMDGSNADAHDDAAGGGADRGAVAPSRAAERAARRDADRALLRGGARLPRGVERGGRPRVGRAARG